MEYKTFEPDDDLAPLIKCYWTLEGEDHYQSSRQTIVPDGCMEMIFHHGDLYRQYEGEDKPIIQPRCFVIGQLTRPLEIEPTGRTGIFSVRFRPGGFVPFANISLKEMENTAVELQKIFGKEGKNLESDILNAHSTSIKIGLINTFLKERLVQADTIDRIVTSAIDSLFEINGQASVKELAEKMNINRKKLERRFSSNVGLSPKQIARIIRLQATLKMMLDKEFESLTSLAYEGGYYDQAHFIKDFKEFTGQTPKHFYGDNLKMSSLFYGN